METSPPKNEGVLQKKRSTPVFFRDCATRRPIHDQARVTFHNFTEVNFRDFLLTGQTFKSGRMIGLAKLVD